MKIVYQYLVFISNQYLQMYKNYFIISYFTQIYLAQMNILSYNENVND